MDGGGSSGSQTTTTVPWEGAQPYIWAGNSLANAAVNNQLPMYGGPTFAPFNPLQIGGQEAALDYTQNRFQPGVGQYQDDLRGMMNAPNTAPFSPAVQGMMQANSDEVMRSLTRDALPQIRSSAGRAGQYGSSKMGLGEGQAIGDAARALSNTNAATQMQAYMGGLQTQQNAAAMTPAALGLGFQGPQMAMQVGQMQQDQYNKAIQEQMQRYYYPEQKMWDTLGKATGIYAGQPTGATTTGTTPGSSTAAGALGGAAAGAGIANALALSGPWGWGLAGVGGLLGAFG